MAHLRSALTALALGSALISRSAVAQHGASVSLTHTVSVTVPPRVKVQVGSAQVAPSAARVSGQPSANGLSLSVSATQPWTLSIGGPSKSRLQWSRDGQSDYEAVTEQSSTVASGELSQIPTSAQVFVRPVKRVISARDGGASDSDSVIFTIVAQ
jgi:spore coat protein U-like protein